MNHLPAEETIVLLLSQPYPGKEALSAAAGLFEETGGKINMKKIDQLSAFCQTRPLLYRNITEAAGNWPDLPEQHKLTYIAHLSAAEMQIRETLEVIAALKNDGVRAISLKGPIAAERLLGDPGLYQSSDIDLLVQPEDMERAIATLANQGYSINTTVGLRNEMIGSYHATVSKQRFHIELHRNLVMRYFDADPGFWWTDAEEVDYRGHTILQLSNEKLLLYLIFRLFSRGFLPLKYFILALGIVSNNGINLDRNRFMRAAGQLKMERLAIFTLNIMQDLFLLDVPKPAAQRKNFFCYGRLRQKALEGLFEPHLNTHLRMLIFLCLLESPADIFRVLLRRLFPSAAEIRIRYNIRSGFFNLLPYYLLNPFLMIFNKASRR